MISIHSENILLRNFCQTDVNAIFSYRSLSEVAKFQYWEPFTLKQAINFVNQNSVDKTNKRGEWTGLAIINKIDNKLIGDCAIKIDENHVEIGCNISPEYQRKGFAKEALNLLINYCFNYMNLPEAIGITDSCNTASIKLMESLGMQRIPDYEEKLIYKGKWCAEHKYSIRNGAIINTTL